MVIIGVSLVKFFYCTCRNGPYLMLLIIGNIILNLTGHKGRKTHLYDTNIKPCALLLSLSIWRSLTVDGYWNSMLYDCVDSLYSRQCSIISSLKSV